MSNSSPPNILVPTDFSSHSEHALRYAASLGERFGATLHLLHAVTVHGYTGLLDEADLPDMGPLLEAADAAARGRLDAGAIHGGEAEATVLRRVARGVNPWAAILEYATEQPIDLIVMAMHSGSGLARLVLGSVTERVLRFAPCPVLVVEKGDRDFVDPATMAVRLQKVVVADDLSEKTAKALEYAVRWLRPYEPEIHLTHVVEFQVPAPYVMAGVDSVFTVDRDLRGRLQTLMTDRSSKLLPEGWRVTTEVCEGKPHTELTTYAARCEADLLLVAGETHIDLKERIMGGMVERIARHAPCPMLVV